MTQSNSVGKRLVAEHRKKMFYRIKIYALCALVGGIFGLTISGFWSGLLNRCSVCGQFDAEQAHRRTLGPDGPVYYWCQPDQMKQFFVPKPNTNTLTPPTDDR